jgi:hypothetical protein
MNDVTINPINNPIASAAVLVELNISVWGASRLDRNETEKVNTAANAVTNAAQVRKDLFAGDRTRKAIADYAAGCRMWHNRQTMPWSDKGARLLPTSLFLEYKSEANNRKAEFDTLVTAFITAYPQLVQDAQSRLGSMFDATEYPDPTSATQMDELRSKFDFRMVFSPVPDAGDFRVDVGTQEMKEMQDSYASAFTSRLAAVTREPWDRLHEMLVGMSEKMTEDDTPRFRNRKGVQQEIKRPYHESFVTNAEKMCEMLAHLNITKDPALERARLALVDAMFGVDIDAIRDSVEVRAEIKSKVDAILANNWTGDKPVALTAEPEPEEVEEAEVEEAPEREPEEEVEAEADHAAPGEW